MAEEDTGGGLGPLGWLLAKLQNAPQNTIFQAGLRGLAQPTVSRYKRGPLEHFGSAWSEGSALASQAQQDAAKNQFLREELLKNQQQAAAMAEITKGAVEGKYPLPEGMSPEMFGRLAAAAPEEATKALFGHYFPAATDLDTKARILGIESDILKERSGRKKIDIENVGAQVANEDVYIAANRGVEALDYLETLPKGLGDWLVSNPKAASFLRQAENFRTAGGPLPEELAEKLSGVPKSEWPKVINALEKVVKMRSTLAAGKATGQQGVAGLEAQYEGFGAGAGIGVNKDVFGGARRTSQRIAELNEWELPDLTGDAKVDEADVAAAESQGVDVKGKGRTAGEIKSGGLGYTPEDGWGGDRGESVYTPLPPETPPAVPPPRKVKTTSIPRDPATGYPKFTREPDVQRAIQAGAVSVGDIIIYNGQQIRAVGRVP